MSPRPQHEYMTVSDLNAEREAVPVGQHLPAYCQAPELMQF